MFARSQNQAMKTKISDSVPHLPQQHQYQSAAGPESQMAVWMQCLCLGLCCYVGYTGWGTVSRVCGRGFGCCLYVSSRRGLSQWRWWQLGNHRSEAESNQTRHCTVQRNTSFPFPDPLSPDGETGKIELLRFTQPNHTCIFTQDVGTTVYNKKPFIWG